VWSVCVCTALLRRRHVTPLVGTPPHTVDIDSTANRNQLSVTVSPVCQSCVSELGRSVQ